MNRYREIRKDFPGRLFCLEGDENERFIFDELVATLRPKFIELGSGAGKHLLELAGRHEGVDCYGFELRYKRAVRTVQKANERGISNVFVVRRDAFSVTELFPPRSVLRIDVNFSDPWPRQRNAKNRLLSARLLDAVEELLTPQGMLAVKTDSREYFDKFVRIVDSDSRFQFQLQTVDLEQSSMKNDNIETEFEQLFRGKGMPICAARIVRAG